MELHLACWAIAMVVLTSRADGSASKCRCVPDQWQGLLSSVERDFDLTGGRTATTENNLHIVYDYQNKKFAMVDSKTGNTALADYKQGLKYLIRRNVCRGMRTDEKMRQMCLPDNANFMGSHVVGTDISVDRWQFHGPFNISMRTTVINKNCIPLTEEVFMKKKGYASVTSSMYLDVKIGIQDRSVFDVPASCLVDAGRQKKSAAFYRQTKRDETAWGTMVDMLRQGMYNF